MVVVCCWTIDYLGKLKCKIYLWSLQSTVRKWKVKYCIYSVIVTDGSGSKYCLMEISVTHILGTGSISDVDNGLLYFSFTLNIQNILLQKCLSWGRDIALSCLRPQADLKLDSRHSEIWILDLLGQECFCYSTYF